MSRRNLLILIVVIAITVFSIVALTVDIGGRKGLVLGLDLAGGTNLVYQADFTGVEEGRHLDALKGAKDIIERRINAYGVAEPVIQIVGGNRISIQLPGVTNIEEAKDLVGKTAELAFREQAKSGKTSVKEPVQSGDTSVVVASTSGFALKDIIVIGSAASAEAVMVKAVYSGNNTIAVETEFEFDHAADESVENLWILAEGTIEGEEIPLTGSYLKPTCYVDVNAQTSEPVVAFEWDDTGAKLFSQITGRLIGKPLGIFLDDILISAPTVQAQIGATGIIEGLNIKDAELLAIQLNAGALPVPLTCIEEKTVDATLGADSIRASLIAGIVGVLLVVAFMTAYYRFSGLLACVALAIYGAIMLMIFKMVPVTLTMAGIAAIATFISKPTRFQNGILMSSMFTGCAMTSLISASNSVR